MLDQVGWWGALVGNNYSLEACVARQRSTRRPYGSGGIHHSTIIPPLRDATPLAELIGPVAELIGPVGQRDDPAPYSATRTPYSAPLRSDT